MNLAKRIRVLVRLGAWLAANDDEWKAVKKDAWEQNKWFTEEFVDHRIEAITKNMLSSEKLNNWVSHYHLDDNVDSLKVGIVMAGNIPLVGFHDLIAVFISGHKAVIKLSEKDAALTKALVRKMTEMDAEVSNHIFFADLLKGCDAYIATGSNNTSRYFDYYFGRYPSIIRRNRTSVAVLSGMENERQLQMLADDVFMYFGLGCKNVTQLYVPNDYDFKSLLDAFGKYNYLQDHDKFKNNYDYNLALLIMNNRKYMSNECIVLVEGDYLFSPVSQLYYAYYKNEKELCEKLESNESVQSIVGKRQVSFGASQDTGLFDYPDGVDTMQFLLSL